MKVAVFGCLHGMLDEMFKAVEQHENQTNTTIDLIVVCGDCQTIRHFDDLTCLCVPNKYKRVGDFDQYYSGKKKIPRLTIFVGGNHEASNYLMTLPFGGWVCDNFYYLGYAGVIKFRGLRIAGVSGIYSFRNHNRGRFERMPLDSDSIRSVYHTRQLDVFRLQLLSENVTKNPIDVFLSHDWPARVYEHGNLEQLLRFKPHFRDDVNSRDGLGSPLTEPLIDQLKPRKWFAAHLHCRFYAKIEHEQSANRNTEFLSLNKIENRRHYVEFLDLIPSKSVGSTDETDSAACSDSQQLGIHDEKNQDNELYYDEEWLTILRKTIALESYSRDKVSCPNLETKTATSYFPTKEEIQETVDLMNKTGGLKIERNFQMSEPVIYNRPGGGNPSVDKGRFKYFPNPQHEELCSRLNIESALDQLIAKEGQAVETNYVSSSSVDHRQQHHNKEQRGRGKMDRQEPRRSSGDRAQAYRPIKRRAYELDEDGCLPFFVDKKGDK